MPVLQPISDFLRRFDHFNDSVIETISVDYGGDQQSACIRIVLTWWDDLADEPSAELMRLPNLTLYHFWRLMGLVETERSRSCQPLS